MRKCGLLGWNPEGMDLPDNHEENGSSGGGRRWALTVVGSFSEQIDAISTESVQLSFYLFIPARFAPFLPRPDNMAKPARPLTVFGLAMSVAREFAEPIDTRQSTFFVVQPALIHSFFPSI